MLCYLSILPANNFEFFISGLTNHCLDQYLEVLFLFFKWFNVSSLTWRYWVHFELGFVLGDRVVVLTLHVATQRSEHCLNSFFCHIHACLLCWQSDDCGCVLYPIPLVHVSILMPEHAVFVTLALWYILKSGIVIFEELFLLFRIALLFVVFCAKVWIIWLFF